MCRLFGIYRAKEGPEAVETTQYVHTMMRKLAYGGPHSWGWITRNRRSKKVGVHKFRGNPVNRRARELTDIDPEAAYIVGHTRYATHGSARDNRNNHPVRHGNVWGVHNGVIFNDQELLRMVGGRYQKGVEVDSEAVFAVVNEFGPKGLEMVEGSCACAWVDLRDRNAVWIARTGGSNLWLGTTAHGSFAWATDRRALEDSGLEVRQLYELNDAVAFQLRPGPTLSQVVELDVPEPYIIRGGTIGADRRDHKTAQDAMTDANEYLRRYEREAPATSIIENGGYR